MRPTPRSFRRLLPAFILALAPGLATAAPVVKHTTAGDVEGDVTTDGVSAFKGIPYAAPPVGALRWQPPQPVAPWTGIRPAHAFGARAMQGRIFSDMRFFDTGPSEDCLYLNVWAPAKAEKLPVMVWIYGGGFVAGATSEPRQNGEKLCQKGVVVVSMNYRLGVFGFYAHPELTAESPHHASGNYGLLDMVAALQWVRDNIAAFGGDPGNVTIFGESAGSFAVSALMASPLAHGLFHKAIGESGAMFGRTLGTHTLAEAEANGTKFAETYLGTTSLEKLRALPADQVLAASLKARDAHDDDAFGSDVDGWFLPQTPRDLFAAGKQNKVPLLAGWNHDEGGPGELFGQDKPTLVNYVKHAKERFGDRAVAFMRAYSATSDAEARRAAADFGGDQFIGFGTWKWIEMSVATGGQPVYRYRFDRDMPRPPDAKPDWTPVAYHSAEIEFVFRVLDSKEGLTFGPDDHKVSELMASYWSNFAKTGNPNGDGLPEWPEYKPGDYQVMHLSAESVAVPDVHRSRYLFLDAPGEKR
ncbi:MAG TPA: carboxylesterase family protein [Lacunisphaera sp.]|nr:carboxylesterase family protein [Lacunisphaera sp.]